jgi:hypothetical protein
MAMRMMVMVVMAGRVMESSAMAVMGSSHTYASTQTYGQNRNNVFYFIHLSFPFCPVICGLMYM